ncbi:MAG: HPr(Ser) kinase/phosphatase, partial [Lachnospiraceae bacterium]|nr:HPr(Ser) kinase/phosphatase [Lachnospiraceae bacterium]
MATLSLNAIVEKMGLTALTPEVDISGIKIHQPDINRIALQMAGYFEHFEATRLQIIGYVEYSYMESLSVEKQEEIFEKLLSYPIPCIIFCRDLQPN